jgi:hypothetical protein
MGEQVGARREFAKPGVYFRHSGWLDGGNESVAIFATFAGAGSTEWPKTLPDQGLELKIDSDLSSQ